MTSSPNSHASNTGNRRHHTPLLWERSNSLTRRQEMMERKSSQSSNVPSTLQHHQGVNCDASMPGTVVVCGVRSAFPLIPVSSAEQVASGSAAVEATSPPPLPTPPPRQQSLRRPSSPTATALLQRQLSSIHHNESRESYGTSIATLTSALQSEKHTPHSGLGKPPLVRRCEGPQDDSAGSEDAARAEGSRLNGQPHGSEAGNSASASPDAASTHDSDTDGVEACTKPRDLAHQDTQPPVQWTTTTNDASPPVRTKHIRSRPHSPPRRLSMYTTTEINMVDTSQERRDVHSDDKISKELHDGPQAPAEGRQSNNRPTANKPFENHTEHDKGRRAVGPSSRVSPNSRLSPRKRPFVSAYAPTTTKAHRPRAPATDAKASALKKNTTSAAAAVAAAAAELLQCTYCRHRASRTGKKTQVEVDKTRPAFLQAVPPPAAISGPPAGQHQQQQQQTRESHVMSTTTSDEKPCESRQAGDSADGDTWHAGGDEKQSTLKTVSACDPQSSSDRLAPAEAATAILEARVSAASEIAGHQRTRSNGGYRTFLCASSPYTDANGEIEDDLPSQEKGVAAPRARTACSKGADKMDQSRENNEDRRQLLRQVEEARDLGYPLGQRRVTSRASSPPRSGDATVANEAGTAEKSDSDQSRPRRSRPSVRASAVELDEIRRLSLVVHEAASSDHRGEEDGSIQKKDDHCSELISCYDVGCQTSPHLLHTSEEKWKGGAERRRVGGEGDADNITSLTPHYAPANRWMCAAGVCPTCHPNRQIKRGTSGGEEGQKQIKWPLSPHANSGYRTPTRLAQLHKLQKSARPATAGNSAHLPKLLLSSSSSGCSHPYRRDHHSATVTRNRDDDSPSREWDLQLHRRQLWLRKSGIACRDPVAAYTPLLLVTSHQVRARERATGEDPCSYRYCDLVTQKMMIHTGFSCADVELDDYNDTLNGAAFLEEDLQDDDAVKTIEDQRRLKSRHRIKLRYPALLEDTPASAGTGAIDSTTTLSGHIPSPHHHAVADTTANARVN